MLSVHEATIVDPRIIPWSMRGSYLCMATKSGQNGSLTPGNDIYLISHIHPGGLPLFALRPNLHGELPPVSGFHRTPSPVDFMASPSRMRWSSGDTTVAEATFQDPRTIRLRGTVPLSFDTEGALQVDQWRCWLFRVPPTSNDSLETVEFTSAPNTALRFVALRGTIALVHDAPYDPQFKNNNRRLTVSADPEAASWELLITERDTEAETPSHPPPLGNETFDGYAEAMGKAFETYVNGMCAWGATGTSAVTSADRLAAYVMWTSTLWSWDNCLNGLALVPYNLDRALDQILLPFQHMTSEGRLPDSLTRTEVLFDYTKPPVYGWTFLKLLQLLDPKSSSSTPSFDCLPRERLLDIFDKVSAFTRYWYRYRSTSLSALPYYCHGNDSGWDNSTAYDRQTVCVSPDLGAFLVVQCDFLALLAAHLGKDHSEWSRLRGETVQALVQELWSEEEGAFTFKDALDGSTWTSSSLLQFVPLVASAHLPSSIVSRMAQNLTPYLSQWGLATERLDSKLYESDGYWRGPIWAPPTIMIESGLRAAGITDLANTISERYVRLCERNGFAENYDAITGQGNRDLSYTWSASAYLTLRKEQEARRSTRVL